MFEHNLLDHVFHAIEWATFGSFVPSVQAGGTDSCFGYYNHQTRQRSRQLDEAWPVRKTSGLVTELTP